MPQVFLFFEALVGIMTLLLTGVILDMTLVLGLIFVFFGNLSNIDPDS